MRKEIKNLWVAALRSGRYIQCTGRLAQKEENGQYTFSSLGVLCEIAVSSKVIEFTVTSSGEMLYGGERFLLPLAVVRWAHLESTDPDLANDKSLTEVEDDLGVGFAKLASLIEVNL